MNTLFHGAANTAAAVRLRRRWHWLRPRTVLWASLIPDVPLFLLSLWYFWRYEIGFGPRYDELFYENPIWVIGHNLFHAPIITVMIGLVGWAMWRQGGSPRRGTFLLSFSFGTTLHTLVDIPTHHHDGPLLLFPFDWTIRYTSPISYWDPAYGGRVMFPIDLGLTLAFTVYLLLAWWRARRRAAQAAGSRDLMY